MNTNNVKKYAPKARKAFIEAMSKQAAKYGITKKKIEPAEQKGDLVLIGDRPFPASVIKPRERLVKRIEQQGFDQVMEHVAYSWFNRLCAIRYMERKGFLDHGRRVLSAADGSAGVPQILEECLDVEFPGLDQAKVKELKLDGTKDEELYRELLLAQCHALHQAMPFLFEAVADESELLLPENLTKTDSLIRELVASVPDEDWDHIEIIGWLYQFYISEKKDQVIGKVVKSEDIPAATQLFTPNWIVQYLVQNSVGRQWLQTYSDSPLKEKMPYYIEPAEQTPEVQAQLAEITPSEIAPESIKVLDPAAGSGHILVEAYKVLKAIYEERGYRTRDIPQLILENNLYGLDIDDRAGQLSGFALMMLAREDDRRIFSRNIRLNVLSLQESTNVNLPSLWRSLNLTGEWQGGTSQGLFEEEQQDLSTFAEDNRYQLLQRTLERFKQAKTFGSLIEVTHDDYEGLRELLVTLCELEGTGDSMQKVAATQLLPYVHQAVLLSKKYDAVVANPPYMGSGYFNKEFKNGLKHRFKLSRTDIYVLFMERNLDLLKNDGSVVAMVTRQDWMFTSSYSDIRSKIVHECSLHSLVHLGSGAFPSLSGEVVQAAAYIYGAHHIKNYVQVYINCSEEKLGKENEFLSSESRHECNSDAFPLSLGSPILYKITESERIALSMPKCFDSSATLREGMHTGNNSKYVKSWWEIDFEGLCQDAETMDSFDAMGGQWALYNKGGTTARWYESTEYVVAFDQVTRDEMSKIKGHVRPSQSLYFKEGGTWSDVATKGFGVRYFPKGHLFDGAGPIVVSDNLGFDIGVMNSLAFRVMSAYVMPNLHFKCGTVKKMPYPNADTGLKNEISNLAFECVDICIQHCEKNEIFYNFKGSYWTEANVNLASEAQRVATSKKASINSLLGEKEMAINERVSSLYGLDEMIYTDEAADNTVLNKYDGVSIEDLVSYSIGCMVGRYSLNREGLIYACSGNKGFSELVAEGVYKTFPADDDGIIPLTDQEWFPDDASNRFREFVKVVWGEEHLHENLDFVAESLCLYAIKPKKSESSMDTIRRYLSTQFYKDHLKTYKKRPIYWLFSSGKQKAFECLVYLHRYNEGTLARMRTEYVIPLTAKMAAYAQKLENDKEASGSAAEVKRLEKEIAQLHKQQAELSEFDEKLRHYADQRISLDLDDGVKANYGKFGDLLADVKAITGEAPEALT